MLITTWWIDALYKQYNTCILFFFTDTKPTSLIKTLIFHKLLWRIYPEDSQLGCNIRELWMGMCNSYHWNMGRQTV